MSETPTTIPQAEGQQPAEEQKEVKRGLFGRKKKEKPKKTPKQEAMEWIITILVAVVIAVPLRIFVCEPVSVDGNSMYATLHDREVMLVDKTEYATISFPFGLGTWTIGGEPERFDVVICHYPDRGNTNFVKRVVGLPGDRISIMGGYLYVNDVKYEEPYLVNRPDYLIFNYTVPEGMYFVLGDNRSNSNDSHIVGPISRDMIMGHVRYVVFPWADRRPIPNGLEDTLPRVLE